MILTIFSFIYGPLVVYLMDAFTPAQSSLAVLAISVLLIALNFKEKSPVWIIPFVYFVISLTTLIFERAVLLQFAPLLISAGVAVLLSMPEKTPLMIQTFLNRWAFLREKNLSKKQIRSNTWVWIAAAWINVLSHVLFLLYASRWLWAFYVSVGWYAPFMCAAVAHLYIWRWRKKHG